MRFLPIIAILAFLGCARNKSAIETTQDNSECVIIRDKLNDYAPDVVFKEANENCTCVETAVCYNKLVCLRIICSE